MYMICSKTRSKSFVEFIYFVAESFLESIQSFVNYNQTFYGYSALKHYPTIPTNHPKINNFPDEITWIIDWVFLSSTLEKEKNAC